MGIFRKGGVAPYQAGPVCDIIEQEPRPQHCHYQEIAHDGGPAPSAVCSSQHRPFVVQQQQQRRYCNNVATCMADGTASMDASRPSLPSSHSGHALSQFSPSSATFYANYRAQEAHSQMHPNGSHAGLQNAQLASSTSSLSVPSSLLQSHAYSTPSSVVQSKNSRNVLEADVPTVPHTDNKKPSIFKGLVKKKNSMPELREKTTEDKKSSSKKKLKNIKVAASEGSIPPVPVIQLRFDMTTGRDAAYWNKSDNIARFSINSMLNSVALRLDEHNEQEQHRKQQEQARLRAEYMRRADLMPPEQREVVHGLSNQSTTSAVTAASERHTGSTQLSRYSPKPTRLAPIGPTSTNPRISSPHYGALTHPIVPKSRMPVQNPSHARQRSKSQPTISPYARCVAVSAVTPPSVLLRPPEQYDESFFSTPRKLHSSVMLSAAHLPAYSIHSTQSRAAAVTFVSNGDLTGRQHGNSSSCPPAHPGRPGDSHQYRPETRPSPASYGRNEVAHPGRGHAVLNQTAAHLAASTAGTPHVWLENACSGDDEAMPAPIAQYATPPRTSSRTNPSNLYFPKSVAGQRPLPLTVPQPTQCHGQEHLLSFSCASSRLRANSDSSALDPFVDAIPQGAPDARQQQSPASSFAALVVGSPSASGPPPGSSLPALPQPQQVKLYNALGHERSPSLRHRSRFQHKIAHTPPKVGRTTHITPTTSAVQCASVNSSASRSGTASSRPSLSVSGSMSSLDTVDPDTSLSSYADDADSMLQLSPDLKSKEHHPEQSRPFPKLSKVSSIPHLVQSEQKPQRAPRSFPLLERHGIRVRQLGL